jgi:hypothetical protein
VHGRFYGTVYLLKAANLKRMKRVILFAVVITALIMRSQSQTIDLPDSIYSGKQGNLHVQVVAVDKTNGHVYFSFTDRLISFTVVSKPNDTVYLT